MTRAAGGTAGRSAGIGTAGGGTDAAGGGIVDGAAATAEALIAFAREHLAHYKAPRTVVFGPLPKTSTGKIQKFVLRAKAQLL